MAASTTRQLTRKRQRLANNATIKKPKIYCEVSDDVIECQSIEANREDKESVASGEVPQQGGIDASIIPKADDKENWKRVLQQGLKKTDWKWSLLESTSEEWKAQLIKMCHSEYCAYLIQNSSMTHSAAHLLAKLDKESSGYSNDLQGIPVWKAELLVRTKQEWKFKALSQLNDEYIASVFANCEYEWLSHQLYRLINYFNSDPKQILLSAISLVSRAKYPWQAQVIVDELLNGHYRQYANFELKANLVLSCDDKDLTPKILAAEDWKIAFLCDISDKWKFKMILETTEEWKCDLLSTVDKYSIGKAIYDCDLKYKATAIANAKSSSIIRLIGKINHCEEWKVDLLLRNAKTEWKTLLIDRCTDEWVAGKISECDERWRAEMFLKTVEQGKFADWKVNAIAEIDSSRLCEIILNRCNFAWQANLIKDIYKKHSWKIEYILKCGEQGDDEEWKANLIASNTSFQWQAEYVLKADTELKASVLSQVTNRRRAGFILEATEEWRISLLADERKVNDDWRMSLMAKKNCCEWKAQLLASCRTEWQARLLINAEEEWRCRLLASSSDLEEWRAKVIAEEKEEWKCNLIGNYTSEQWRVELMRNVDTEWQVRLIHEIPQVWKVKVIAKLRRDQQTIASSILSQAVTSEEQANEIIQGLGSASRMFH